MSTLLEFDTADESCCVWHVSVWVDRCIGEFADLLASPQEALPELESGASACQAREGMAIEEASNSPLRNRFRTAAHACFASSASVATTTTVQYILFYDTAYVAVQVYCTTNMKIMFCRSPVRGLCYVSGV